jgi:hypothetical protein
MNGVEVGQEFRRAIHGVAEFFDRQIVVIAQAF